jgi:hypothetical protein
MAAAMKTTNAKPAVALRPNQADRARPRRA